MQLINLLNKHLTNAPCGATEPYEIMAGMAQAVAAMVCCGESIAAAGTCHEEARRLAAGQAAAAAQSAAQRKRARQAAAAARRAAKQERAAQRAQLAAAGDAGQQLDTAEDLEDSDAEGSDDPGDDMSAELDAEAAEKLLPAVAWSKVAEEWIAQNQEAGGVRAKLARALQLLLTQPSFSSTGELGDMFEQVLLLSGSGGHDFIHRLHARRLEACIPWSLTGSAQQRNVCSNCAAWLSELLNVKGAYSHATWAKCKMICSWLQSDLEQALIDVAVLLKQEARRRAAAWQEYRRQEQRRSVEQKLARAREAADALRLELDDLERRVRVRPGTSGHPHAVPRGQALAPGAGAMQHTAGGAGATAAGDAVAAGDIAPDGEADSPVLVQAAPASPAQAAPAAGPVDLLDSGASHSSRPLPPLDSSFTFCLNSYVWRFLSSCFVTT